MSHRKHNHRLSAQMNKMPATPEQPSMSVSRRLQLNALLFVGYVMGSILIGTLGVLSGSDVLAFVAQLFASSSLPAAVYVNWPIKRWGIAFFFVLFPIAFVLYSMVTALVLMVFFG